MVSGVGPAAELQSLGIPVVADLDGVGRDMWVCCLQDDMFGNSRSETSQLLADLMTNCSGPARLRGRDPCEHSFSQCTLQQQHLPC